MIRVSLQNGGKRHSVLDFRGTGAIITFVRAYSSAGRASGSQPEGRGFEPRCAHCILYRAVQKHGSYFYYQESQSGGSWDGRGAGSVRGSWDGRGAGSTWGQLGEAIAQFGVSAKIMSYGNPAEHFIGYILCDSARIEISLISADIFSASGL